MANSGSEHGSRDHHAYGMFTVFGVPGMVSFIPKSLSDLMGCDLKHLTYAGTVCVSRYEGNVFTSSPSHAGTSHYSRHYSMASEGTAESCTIRSIGVNVSDKTGQMKAERRVCYDLFSVKHNGCTRYVVRFAHPALVTYCRLASARLPSVSRTDEELVGVRERLRNIIANMQQLDLLSTMKPETIESIVAAMVKTVTESDLETMEMSITNPNMPSGLRLYVYYMLMPCSEADPNHPCFNMSTSLDMVDFFEPSERIQFESDEIEETCL